MTLPSIGTMISVYNTAKSIITAENIAKVGAVISAAHSTYKMANAAYNDITNTPRRIASVTKTYDTCEVCVTTYEDRQGIRSYQRSITYK